MSKKLKKKLPLPSPKQNNILASLSKADYERILPNLKLIDMPLGWTMSESGDHIHFMDFPISGVVSLMYLLEDGSTSETALVGREGMVGISIYMGGESLPSSTEVQTAGQAYRMTRQQMRKEFALGGEMQQLSLLFAQGLFSQTSQTAVCNQHHSVEQQLCRWMLMTSDRLRSPEILITQESIGRLLGVRRETVTNTVSQLQKDDVIERSRGRVKIVNREKLEKRACECYAAVRDEYERLFPGCMSLDHGC